MGLLIKSQTTCVEPHPLQRLAEPSQCSLEAAVENLVWNVERLGDFVDSRAFLEAHSHDDTLVGRKPVEGALERFLQPSPSLVVRSLLQEPIGTGLLARDRMEEGFRHGFRALSLYPELIGDVMELVFGKG
jgi:hypothetical protein